MKNRPTSEIVRELMIQQDRGFKVDLLEGLIGWLTFKGTDVVYSDEIRQYIRSKLMFAFRDNKEECDQILNSIMNQAHDTYKMRWGSVMGTPPNWTYGADSYKDEIVKIYNKEQRELDQFVGRKVIH